MPNGYIGNPARGYLEIITNVMLNAEEVHSKDPFENLSNRTIPPPSISPGRSIPIPYHVDTAMSGSFTLGIGDSSNIVVGQSEYESVLNQIEEVDEIVGQELYDIAAEIETLFDVDYVLPRAGVKCKMITMGVKECMNDFRSLTEACVSKTKTYVNGIMSIG